jgi:hypothetical protein
MMIIRERVVISMIIRSVLKIMIYMMINRGRVSDNLMDKIINYHNDKIANDHYHNANRHTK